MASAISPDVSTSVARTENKSGFRWQVWLKVIAIVGIFTLSLLIRLRAADYLTSDYDEDDYLRAGQLYAQHIAAGDIAGIANERENYEHPPMTKLAFGAVLYLTQGTESYANPVIAYSGSKDAAPGIARQAHSLRVFGSIIGATTAGIVAFVNPLAGLLVGLNSWHIKYTSQAMLEALPCLFAAITLLLLSRTKRNEGKWWWLAAISLGFCAAGKYLYGVGGIAAVIWMLWRDRKSWRRVLAWVGVAIVAFYVANPALWFNPVGNLLDSLAFNTSYATGKQVETSGFGWAQPITWLLSAVPWLPRAHPEVFPLLWDGLFSALALLALRRMWRGGGGDRLVVLWLGINMLFLLFWPTKWPQYILAVTVPISLAASRFLQDFVLTCRDGWKKWRSSAGANRRNLRAAAAWLSPAVLLLLLIVVYPLLLQFALATTGFKVNNLRDGTGALLGEFGRGLIGVAPDTTTTSPILYSGTGSIFNLFMAPTFVKIVRYNILWATLSIGLATIFGLWLGTLLQRKGVWGRQIWRVIFILPWAIPEFVGALIWSTLFDDLNGGINNFFNVPVEARTGSSWLGDATPLIDFSRMVKPVVDTLNSWKLTPFGGILEFVAEGFTMPTSFWIMVLVGVWVSFPFMMLVSTVALRSISAEVIDAARVDGAKGWTMWTGMTWPLISPNIWAGVLLRGVLLFNAFHIPLMLINNNRPSGNDTLAGTTYLAMRYGSDFSIPALLNIVTMLVAIGLIWLFNRQTKVIEGVQYV